MTQPAADLQPPAAVAQPPAAPPSRLGPRTRTVAYTFAYHCVFPRNIIPSRINKNSSPYALHFAIPCDPPALPPLAQVTCRPNGSAAHFRPAPSRVRPRILPAARTSLRHALRARLSTLRTAARWPPHVTHRHGHVVSPTAGTRIPCPPSGLQALRTHSKGFLSIIPLAAVWHRSSSCPCLTLLLHAYLPLSTMSSADPAVADSPLSARSALLAALERRGRSLVGGPVPWTEHPCPGARMRNCRPAIRKLDENTRPDPRTPCQWTVLW